MAPKRYLVQTDEPPDLDLVKRAIGFVVRLSQENDNVGIVILVSTWDHLTRSNLLSDVLGLNVSRALAKGRSFDLPSGGKLRAATERTFRSVRGREIIVGMFGGKKTMDLLDDPLNSQATAIVFVPWLPAEGESWRQTWNPIVVGSEASGQPRPEAIIENPVVEKALEALTNRINLGSGLAHPSDRSSAVQLFRLLRRDSEAWDPDAVRRWAVRNGWSPHAADELHEVAEGIQQGRGLRSGGAGMWPSDFVSQLRAEVSDEKSSP